MKLLVAYESSTQYQPRFDFYGIGERSVRTNISKKMNKAITKALWRLLNKKAAMRREAPHMTA